jgi:hypothetical protein
MNRPGAETHVTPVAGRFKRAAMFGKTRAPLPRILDEPLTCAIQRVPMAPIVCVSETELITQQSDLSHFGSARHCTVARTSRESR